MAAARSGDRQALDELIAIYLPFVYNIVGRAMSGHPDTDDVVQDTMLRAVRNLGSLRDPQGFRTWLATIAVNQVSTYLHRGDVASGRNAALDEAAGLPDAGADFEDLTILRLGLSGQRRQAVLASRWLDPDDRTLLSLWWLETAGHLTRTQLADAMGLSTAHAGVRVQRMLDQFELSRAIVAALAARPHCARLSDVLTHWDGRPSALWRKRIGRHVRGCPVCGAASEGLVPTPRLLVGLALVPVPMALTAALFAKGSAAASVGVLGGAVASGASGAKVGFLGQLAHAVSGHRVAAAVAGGAVVAGTVAFALAPWSPPREPDVVLPPPPPTTSAAVTSRPAPTSARPTRPSASPTRKPSTSPTPTRPAIRAVAHGPLSLEATDRAGEYVTLVSDLGTLTAANPGSAADVRQNATFEVVAGLADARCVSLRTSDGRYLRHSSWRLRPATDDGTVLFREDSTFCPRAGTTSDSVALESYNYPGRFLRHVDTALWIDPTDDTTAFRTASSFRIRPALAN
ncbi:hypothetical protein GCM10009682_62200 [Luedemannella flava]|uniref:Sigma-70 family RNA polymerase sigma factor n=1 Tax=Luedemannella flava TaxID=349316 RepID=A0ABP4Z1P9_9ACTN